MAAFGILAAELAHHGAPEALIRSARATRRDEGRHYRLMRALARAHGADVPRPSVPPRAVRARDAV